VKRTVAVAVALGGISLVAVVSASSGGSPRPYTVAATKACLLGLPDAVVGLPPATPPVPPALFVYTYPPNRSPSPAHGQLGTWYGPKGKATYSGIILSFFKTPEDARASAKSESPFWFRLYGGKVIRNVVVGWADHVPTRTVQTTVLGCLRAGTATPPPLRPTPHASLATFTGYWGGHTRSMWIKPNGRGSEHINSGCCYDDGTVHFQLLRAKGTLENATATFRITALKRGDGNLTSKLHVGQVGRLVLKNGIVTDNLTGVYYCSNPAWGATGACGA
jgi:hypothetical protein